MTLHDKRILITGGGGFLGTHLRHALQQHGLQPQPIPTSQAAQPGYYCPGSRLFDLGHEPTVQRLLQLLRPQVVIHLAALCGGIGANRARPAEFYYHNLLMGTYLMEHSCRAGVDKYVSLGTVCSYPKHTPVPFREEALWDGYPEETNSAYGLAKKMQLVQGQAYRQQYGLNAIHLLPVNLYGPHDHFDLAQSHVIPALIRKFATAARQGDSTVQCWGTGTATREFLYAADCARGILQATEQYDGAEPVNLGSGQEVSIARLAELVAAEVGYTGQICWDPQQPDGQPRRLLDCSRARQFGFTATTSLRDGLRATVSWYRQHEDQLCRTA